MRAGFERRFLPRWPCVVKPEGVCRIPEHLVDPLLTFPGAAGTDAPQGGPVEGVRLMLALQGKLLRRRWLSGSTPGESLVLHKQSSGIRSSARSTNVNRRHGREVEIVPLEEVLWVLRIAERSD